ncbi:hypothetical protein G6011_09904 [Alternaria panax]|uniref:Uncharacterized protein n=1 Tax=Alternaria panax TaxID=48097 RepID=A0AAD4FCX6_9PLEO|nr:hypothetical protein G6011_09904 [Alternaria panax]
MTGMDGRQNRFDRSGAMHDTNESYPKSQEIESQKWHNALKSSQRALTQSMNSPAYRRFLANTALLWDQEPRELHESSSGIMRGGRGGDAVRSTTSDTTVKVGNSYKGRHDGYAQSPVPIGAGIAQAGHLVLDFSDARSGTPLSLRNHTLTGMSTESPPQVYSSGPGHAYAKPIMRNTSCGWLFEQAERSQGPFHSVPKSSASKISTPTVPAGLRPSNLFSPLGSPEDLHMTRRTNLHERRQSDRISSLPSIGSPLGPGRMREQLHEGDNRRVPLSSVSKGSFIQREYEMGWRRPTEDVTQAKEPKQRKRGPSSPTVQRYASTGSVSPAFDITPRSAQIDDQGNIFINGSGHARKHTDPFVDPEPIQYGSRSARPSMAGPSTTFQFPSEPSMRSPSTPVSAVLPNFAPTNSGFARQPTPAVTLPFSATLRHTTPLTPAFLTSASGTIPRGRPPMCSSLPILPPPLSSIQGKYHHTPAARAHLEAQKPTREAWIRAEAAKIAQLARKRQAAYITYMETQDAEDYQFWQMIEVEYADATNTEKRKEERRNLFLNGRGMLALKTDQVGDMSADSRQKGVVDGEEKMLGYQMATMERVCAEVKRDEGDAIITADMLATLNLDEKKALRKHLLGRLERS